MATLANHQSSKFTKLSGYRVRGILTPLTKENIEYWIFVEGECWLWRGAVDKAGYARLGGRLVSNIVWRLFNGQLIPPGIEICHSCDNTLCVNPSHLFTGTHHENMIDAKLKKRMGRRINPKLTPEIYSKILQEMKDGKLLKEIAWRYGISPAYMTKIKRGRVVHVKS